MAAPKHAMAAFPADRVKIVVLGMALLAEPRIFVSAPGAPFAIPSARTLGSLSFSVCNCDHWKTYWKGFIFAVTDLTEKSYMGEYHTLRPRPQNRLR